MRLPIDCDTSRCQESWRNTWVEQVMTCTYYPVYYSRSYFFHPVFFKHLILANHLFPETLDAHPNSANRSLLAIICKPASTSIEIFHIGRRCTKLLASLHLFLILTRLPPIQIAPAPATPPVETPKTPGPSETKKACNHVRGNFQHPWMDYLTTCNQLTGVLLTVRKL